MASGIIPNEAQLEIGTWEPKFYDYETYKWTAPAQYYVKIGPVYFLFCYINPFTNLSFSTMLQIRNFPCRWVEGGTIYAANASGQLAGKTIQSSDVGVYVRPNYTGTINGGVFSCCLIGYDP